VNNVTHERICVRKIYTQKLACELSWIAPLVPRANMRYHAKCCADRANRCRDIVIYRMHLKFVTDQTVTRAELRHRAKFCSNRWTCGRDMVIFRFFKMTAAAILDFGNFKILTVGMVQRVELHHHAKFCQNRSNRDRDMAIFRFFQDGGRRHGAILDFWNFKFWTIGTVKRVELHHRAKFRQNRSNRGWDITIFPRWRPSGILDL